MTYGRAVCVCVGLWGAFTGTEVITGIVSQCSCPEWEMQRNRFMVCVCSKRENKLF